MDRSVMAMTQQQRDQRQDEKRKARGEEEIRFRTLAGTRAALADLMDWSGITEQGEVLTLMIHRLHELGPQQSAPLLDPPRHEITVTQKVALKLEQAAARESLRICAE
jgi:hypothetical protein